MKVLNLRCTNEHRFEGWFASDADFVEQTERGLMTCPICEDSKISRLPAAPRIVVGGSRDSDKADKAREAAAEAPTETPVAPTLPTPQQLQAQWLSAMRHMIRNTEDVGDRFPEEARRIHYGETPERGIRGRASTEDAAALRDEGIEVVSVPLPPALKGTVQ